MAGRHCGVPPWFKPVAHTMGWNKVVENAAGSPGKMGALLSAVQNEPAGVVYGAIVFLLLVGFALLIPTSKWRKWVTGHKQRRGS